jgi:hypothetical protein
MRLIAVAVLIGLTVTGCASKQVGAGDGGPDRPATGTASLPLAPSSSASGGASSAGRGAPSVSGGSSGASGGAPSGSGTSGSQNPGTGGAQPSAPSDNPAANVRCPSQLNFDQPNGPAAQAIPPAIKVTWVLRCSIVAKVGQPRTLLAERSDSDPTELVNALRVPSGPRMKGLCPMFRMLVPYFALVQSDGQVLVPKVPVNSCGMIDPAVVLALSKMQFEVLSNKPLP